MMVGGNNPFLLSLLPPSLLLPPPFLFLPSLLPPSLLLPPPFLFLPSLLLPLPSPSLALLPPGSFLM